MELVQARSSSKESRILQPKAESTNTPNKQSPAKTSFIGPKDRVKGATRIAQYPIVHKSARPGTAVDEARRQTAYANKNFAGGTVLRVEGAFSKKISLRRDVGTECLAKKKLAAADALSDDDLSVETVKKESTLKNSAAKKKTHKIAMCLYNERSEIGLIKHFLEAGEWKKVLTPQDAVFTFVNNERNLDWGISKHTMVGRDYFRSTRCLVSVSCHAKESSPMSSTSTPGCTMEKEE